MKVRKEGGIRVGAVELIGSVIALGTVVEEDI